MRIAHDPVGSLNVVYVVSSAFGIIRAGDFVLKYIWEDEINNWLE